MRKGKAYKPENSRGWWRDVCGYGGKYQVSRHGEVRRVFDSGIVHNMVPFRRKQKPPLFVKLTRKCKKTALTFANIATNTSAATAL